jgi:hypothetical protein
MLYILVEAINWSHSPEHVTSLPKRVVRVRFPSPAPVTRSRVLAQVDGTVRMRD